MENSTRHYSTIQESKICSYLGGTLTPNSGARHKKGDIHLPNTIVECKTRTKRAISHTIKKEWILDLVKECIEMGKQHWAIVFDFGEQKLNEQYVVIPLDDYKEYLELKEAQND